MSVTKSNSTSTNQNSFNSKKSAWQKVEQQVKSLFSTNPEGKMVKNEIDYYHQYLYSNRIERMSKAKSIEKN